MRIWAFNHYASPPDQPMTGAYFIAHEMAKRGHAFSFFSSSYNYYQRREIRLTAGESYKAEDFDGVEFVWVKTRPHSARLASRGLNMLSYFFSGLRAAHRTKQRPDFVIGSCPHLLAVLLAYIVARAKKAKFVFEVRDLWPQTFVDHHVLSDTSLATRILRALELFLYRRADLIVTVLPYASRYIEPLGILPDKIMWIPNGIRTDSVAAPTGAASGQSDGEVMTFIYAGGHARYHGLEFVLEAIALVERDRPAEACFRFIGEGVEKDGLVAQAAELGLENVEFVGSVPRNKLQKLLADADAFIYHMRKMNVLRFGVSPNKLCDYLLAGRPVVCALEAPNNPVRDADAGFSIPPEDPQAMAAAIIRMIDAGEAERLEMGQRGREHVIGNFDCAALAARFEEALMGRMEVHALEQKDSG